MVRMTVADFFAYANTGSVKVMARRAAFIGLALLGACGNLSQPNFDKQDRGAGLDRGDYRDALKPRAPENDGSSAPPPIPQAESLVPMPNLALPANARSVTISVNENVPIREVLVELAQQANVGLELDPRISGSLIFSVRQRPFEEVIERIADMADLRYNLNGNVLRIERDLPYLQSYRVDYLNVIRDTKSSVSTTVDVVGGEVVGGEGSGGQGNSSASEVSSESKNNFWEELEANVSMLMNRSAERKSLLTEDSAATLASDANVSSGAPNPLPLTPIAAQPGSTPSATSGLAQQLENIPGLGSALANPTQTAGAAGAAVPADVAAPLTATAAAVAAVATAPPNQRPYSINRVAGLINVYGTQRQHKMIEGYLRKLRRAIAGQVLIEAKVLEVQLSDNYEGGINWAGVLGAATGAARFGNTVAVPQSGPFDGLNAATSGVVTLALDRNDIDAVASLAQQFGTVRTLSSPRLTVQHNQSAVLKVVENRVFFELDFERTTNETTNTDRVTVDSNIRTVPEGVIITVQPSIHSETDEIGMTLRPTITRITGTINDPGVSIASNNTVQSPVPIIAVQEIDSVVTVRSGRVLVMGGLMQDSAISTDTGLPGASSLPVIGNLFKARSDANRQTELVIFLRATIIEDSGASPADIDLYKTFGRDRRPLPF
ncbi:MAG: secretin N-terminal domain-containing protein [Pseudomonadota bacterium]